MEKLKRFLVLTLELFGVSAMFILLIAGMGLGVQWAFTNTHGVISFVSVLLILVFSASAIVAAMEMFDES